MEDFSGRRRAYAREEQVTAPEVAQPCYSANAVVFEVFFFFLIDFENPVSHP
jgi:hypothetical protein